MLKIMNDHQKERIRRQGTSIRTIYHANLQGNNDVFYQDEDFLYVMQVSPAKNHAGISPKYNFRILRFLSRHTNLNSLVGQ